MTHARFQTISILLAVVGTTQVFGQTQSNNALILLNEQPHRAANHSLVEDHLRAFGASGIIHYNAVNAISATLPPLTLDRLSADPNIAKVLAYPVASSSAMFDLLGQIDRAAASSATSVVNAILPDGAADPDPVFSRLLDRLIDNYHLTVVLQGGLGMQANAITVGPGDVSGLHKPDLAGAESESSIRDAISRMTEAGINHPLARKAILINTADAASGWSPDSGWGHLSPVTISDALSAFSAANSGQPVCVEQGQTAQSAANTGASPCFIGSTANSRSYQIKSGSAAKITVAWNRGFATDGTAYRRNLELHVYDMEHHELAADTSEGNNVHQVTAQSDSGLIVKVVLAQPIEANSPPLSFALASSVPLTTNTVPCAVTSISPSSLHFPSQGNTQSVTITMDDPGCYWNLQPAPNTQDFFLAYQGAGTGTVTFDVTAPPNTLTRALTEVLMTIASGGPETSVSATQDAGGAVQPPSIANLIPNGGQSYIKGSQQVITWTYTPGAPPVSSSTGTIELLHGGAAIATLASSVSLGSQTLSWTVPSSVPSDATYTIRITPSDPSTNTAASASPFAITDPACTFTASSPNPQFTYAGGPGSINITAIPSTCSYTVANDSPSWLTLGSAKGTGSGAVGFTVAANTQVNGSTTARPQATLTVNGMDSTGKMIFTSQPLYVNESGLACTFTPPSTVSLAASGAAQTFSFPISNADCQWTATSTTPGFYVQNDNKVQSGVTTGTVTYSAKPNTTPVQIIGHIQVGGGGTVDVKEDGTSPPITITTPDGQNIAEGDTIPVTWTYGSLSGNDIVKATITVNGKDTPVSTTNSAQGGNLPGLPKKGNSQAYTIKVTDTVANVTVTKTITVYFPKITVTAPDAKTPLSRSHPAPITWTIEPKEANIGDTVTIKMTDSKGTTLSIGFAEPNTGKYTPDPKLLDVFKPGAGYTIEVDSDKLKAGKPKWFGLSGKFTLDGIKISSPLYDGVVVVDQATGKVHVDYDYTGSKQVKLTITDSAGKQLGILWPAPPRKADVQVGKDSISLGNIVKAETVEPVPETDTSEKVTLAGIIIPAATGTGGLTTISFTALGVGPDGIGATYNVTVGNYSAKPKDMALKEGANTASVQLPAGSPNQVVYTITITTDKNFPYTGTLTVKK